MAKVSRAQEITQGRGGGRRRERLSGSGLQDRGDTISLLLFCFFFSFFFRIIVSDNSSQTRTCYPYLIRSCMCVGVYVYVYIFLVCESLIEKCNFVRSIHRGRGGLGCSHKRHEVQLLSFILQGSFFFYEGIEEQRVSPAVCPALHPSSFT